MQKKYMVSQSEASRGNSWGGGIKPWGNNWKEKIMKIMEKMMATRLSRLLDGLCLKQQMLNMKNSIK